MTGSRERRARGLIRMYLENPGSIRVSRDHAFVARRGVQYRTTEEAWLSEEDMKEFNEISDKTVYFLDIEIEALNPGDNGNLPDKTKFATDPSGIAWQSSSVALAIIEIESVGSIG